MQDQIFIRNLECFANHGVFQEEQVLGQKFLVSAVLYTDTMIAGKTDELSLSINYATVCEAIQRFMKEHTFRLIEAVAEQLAQSLLLEFPLVHRIKLEIKKPWAPVCMSLDTVGVSVERGWHTVYLGLGSNLGDKEANMQKAIAMFSEHPLCKECNCSTLYQTKPYGVKEQDNFLNAAMSMKTLLSPREILAFIGQVEQELNRVREMHWGPRTIDVDILFYDALCMYEKDLIIPHIEVAKRDFVLAPLTELNPYLEHPVLHKSIVELYENLQKQEGYEKNII